MKTTKILRREKPTMRFYLLCVICFTCISITFMVFSLILCQAPKDNVELTDFTKELISLYMNSEDNRLKFDGKNKQYEMIISAYSDELSYYLTIHRNNNKFYKYCQDDFIGKTLYQGHRVKVYGDTISPFYSIIGYIKQAPCEPFYIEYDPPTWQVCLYRDMSFCKMRTYRVSEGRDISLIQNLAEKYFVTPDTVPKYDN